MLQSYCRLARHRLKVYLGPHLMLLLASVFVIAVTGNVLAAPVAPITPTTVVLSRVRTLENRFFFHAYEQDPIEKRLQRLELLVFGQTKSGDDQQRLHHLNITIAERDRESALKLQQQHQSPKPSSGVAAGKQNYPAVTALEWRALKKSYPDESLDDRLGRLETRLFGQPSPTLSYADRVDRLNRTLGIGAVASAPGSRLRGPLPRTRPQGEGLYGDQGGFFGFSTDPNQKQISELFKQMNEQMEEMMRMTPGFIPYTEENPAPSAPQKKKYKASPELKIPSGNWENSTPPPYNDPNSI